MPIPVKFKRLHPAAKIPVYSTEQAAGADLSSVEYAIIPAGETKIVKCGFAIEIPPGFEVQVRPRSGLAAKNGITVLNTPGTIDSDYRGEMMVILINHGQKDFVIEPGDRIAQMVLSPVLQPIWQEVEELGETERGEGRFGSTGVK